MKDTWNMTPDEARKYILQNWFDVDKFECGDKEYTAMAIAVEALEATKWHYPSRGEYPTDHTVKTRIVANNFGVTSAIYDWTEKRWYDNYNCHIPIDNVYAWCELPEPPKEEA